jgi:uroporphyrinogen-III synthase
VGDIARPGPLAGRRLVTTREHRGELEARLVDLGAEVVHIPSIETVDIDVPAVVEPPDMLIVTSPNGARRAAPWIAPGTRLAAVGDATARMLGGLAGRPVDIVPDEQTATGLAAVLPAPPPGGPRRLVVLRGDLAGSTVTDAARSRGWDTADVTVYSTRLRPPTDVEVAAAAEADAVLIASGSAARAWSDAIAARPAVWRAIVIGPPSAAVAREVGFDVIAVADPHSVPGLVAATVAAVGRH